MQLQLPIRRWHGHIQTQTYQLLTITELVKLLSDQLAKALRNHGATGSKPPRQGDHMGLAKFGETLKIVFTTTTSQSRITGSEELVPLHTGTFLALPCLRCYSRGCSYSCALPIAEW